MKRYELDITMVCMGMPMSGSTIPSGQSLGGCVTGDTPIDVPRDLKAYPNGIPIKELCGRVQAGENFLVYSYDSTKDRIGLRPITRAWCTNQNAEIWELTYAWDLPSGKTATSSLRATADHRIMLRDGSYKPLSDLLPGDSLMPFNRFLGPRKNSKYYRVDLNNGDCDYEHMFVVKELGLPYNQRRGKQGDVVHHINFRWYDNSPANLQPMDWHDHLALHKGPNKAFREWYDNLSPEEYAEFCKKQSDLSRSFWDNAPRKERRRVINAGLKALKQWHKEAPPEELQAKFDKISISNKITFARPELRAQLVANGKKTGGWNKGQRGKIKQSEVTKAKLRAVWADPIIRAERLKQLTAARSNIDYAAAGRKGAAVRYEIHNHVVISVRKLNYYEDVYDLEVAGTHNFVANGIVIHNSETAAAQAATALVRAGNRVNLFCNTDTQHEADGVMYMPMGWVDGPGNSPSKFPKGFFDFARTAPTDVMLVQRQPILFQFEYPSKANVLWQHDLATRQGPSFFGNVVWNIDKILVLSRFMRQQYQSIHGGPDSLYHLTRNGVDLRLVGGVPVQARDRFKLMFTARPERGLDILLLRVWPEVLKREPRAKLYLSRYGDVATLPLYTEMAEVAKQYGDSVINLNNLGKQDLYAHYKQARLFLYPSVFEEISHITSMELGACGTPMIGPWKGACPETCAGSHVLIRDDGSIGTEGDPIDPGFKVATPAFIQTFVDQVIDLIHNDQRWAKLSAAARARAEQWQWGPVAEDWTELFHQIIGRKSEDPKRLVKHLLLKSDVVAAQKYVADSTDPALKKAVDKYIDRFVPFMRFNSPAERRTAIAQFYEERSGGGAADYRTAFWADGEPRLKVLLDWLTQHQGDIKSLLDFGCAHGGYARSISNALPALGVLGVDVSPSLIRCANELKAARMPDGQPAFLCPSNAQFLIADEDTSIYRCGSSYSTELKDTVIGQDAKFDCVVAMEVLEHLPNCEEVVTKLERHCKPGGWVIFTVPVGNRERSEFVVKGVPPVHVRSFDQHDILDLFGHRQDFQVLSFSDLAELEMDRTFAGWYMVAYRKDDKAVGAIDYERKFFLQGPRETLAVCMMVHNSEDTLHRCLRSVQRVADQIVVVDNGPSMDRTINVALEYTEDVRAGTSPFFCYAHLVQHPFDQIQPGVCDMAGFETPRNESIDGVWADWVLWIDSDEQLLEFRNLYKYLRSNTIMGYAIQQHHIAVDPPGVLKCDIPVRLFRSGADIKFYGKVHEHAELGINKGVGNNCMLLPDTHIHHDGYLTETIRRQRFWRNFRLLQCDRLKYPDRILGVFLYDIRDNMHLAKYAMEANGQKLTPEVQQYLVNVVTAFRQHFLSSEYAFLTEDALNYYSEAMAFLGQGVEVCVSMDIKPVGAQLNGTQRFRAMDQGEARQIMDKMIGAKFAPYEGPYSR